MKKGMSQQIPMKSRGSLGNTLENLYSNKLHNLEETDTFDLPKLNQENINHLNTAVASNEIQAIIESPNLKKPKS
jgi:hypothetical protein